MNHYLKDELYDLVRKDPKVFDFLQEGTMDGIWYLNIETKEEWMSPQFKELFGYSDEEIQNTNDWWLNNIFPEDRAVSLRNFKAHCEDPNHPYDQIVRYRHKNGSTVWVRSRGIAIRNDKGVPTRMLGTHIDITALKKHEEVLNQQKATLQASNEHLEQFVYIASHDLREPLIGVVGYATLLQRRFGDQLNEQGQHFLEEIVQGCKNMEAKIDDLLELSRAGRETTHRVFSLGAAVEEARRNVVAGIQKTGASIVATDLPNVTGDRSQIAQLLQNLFSNSLKYRKKDESPVIKVTAQRDPEDPMWWQIRVHDNGIGFDMRHAKRIFGVFQRLYTNDQYPGTGIGLAIVKKILDRHGGRIWVLSEPKKGTTFVFTLRAAEAP